MLPDNIKNHEQLRNLVLSGKRTFNKKMRAQINYELGIIEKRGYTETFLQLKETVDWARSQKIPVGPGRGKLPGSLTAYALGLTMVNPIEYNLVFERLMDSSSRKPIIIQIDFGSKNFNRVKDFVREQFGSFPEGVAILNLEVLDYLHSVESEIRKRDSRFTLEEIFLDDEQTLRSLGKGETEGIFYLDYSGFRETLNQLQPISFMDLVNLNALSHPGLSELLPVFRESSDTQSVLLFIEQLEGGAQEFQNSAFMEQRRNHLVMKSHIIPHVMMGYWCAYLQIHYPHEVHVVIETEKTGTP
jgi:DNA polymerase III alpha subunit